MRLLGPSKLGNNGKYWTREKNMLRQSIRFKRKSYHNGFRTKWWL